MSESYLQLPKLLCCATYRAVCGIRDKTLIINLPGSKKAVVECFEAIQSVLAHGIELIRDDKAKTVATHQKIQSEFNAPVHATIPVTSGYLPNEKSNSYAVASRKSPFETSTTYADSVVSEASEIHDLLNQSTNSMEEVRLKACLRQSFGSCRAVVNS